MNYVSHYIPLLILIVWLAPLFIFGAMLLPHHREQEEMGLLLRSSVHFQVGPFTISLFSSESRVGGYLILAGAAAVLIGAFIAYPPYHKTLYAENAESHDVEESSGDIG